MAKATFDKQLEEISNQLKTTENDLADFKQKFSMQKLSVLIEEKLDFKKAEVENSIRTTIEVKLWEYSAES